MKIILTGATGMVGSEVLRTAIADDRFEKVTCIVRKPLTIQHPKVETIIHNDFLNYESVSNAFADADACIWCLGISQTQVNKEQYEIITYQYAVEAAKEMLKVNPSITFLFLSGRGADTTERSNTLFAKIKGKTENALSALAFKHLFIVRPGAIKAVNGYPNPPLAYKIFMPLIYPLFKLFYPSILITSVELAKAILNIVLKQPEQALYENADLKKWATF